MTEGFLTANTWHRSVMAGSDFPVSDAPYSYLPGEMTCETEPGRFDPDPTKVCVINVNDWDKRVRVMNTMIDDLQYTNKYDRRYIAILAVRLLTKLPLGFEDHRVVLRAAIEGEFDYDLSDPERLLKLLKKAYRPWFRVTDNGVPTSLISMFEMDDGKKGAYIKVL